MFVQRLCNGSAMLFELLHGGLKTSSVDVAVRTDFTCRGARLNSVDDHARIPSKTSTYRRLRVGETGGDVIRVEHPAMKRPHTGCQILRAPQDELLQCASVTRERLSLVREGGTRILRRPGIS
jgi:hypothetical protein